MMRICLLLPMLFVLTACAGITPTPVVEVPTLAQLPTLTATFTPSDTPTQTETLTAAPTLTDTGIPSAAPSFTPSITITDTDTPTPTATPSNTPEPNALDSLVQLAMQTTILPPTYTVNLPTPVLSVPTVVTATLAPASVTCAYSPPGGFAALYANDAALSGQLGCPFGSPPTALSITSASQLFEHGAMFYLAESPAHIYVLFGDGHYRRFDDTFVGGVDPERGGEAPPANLIEPVRGFGKVWRSNADVRASLGWALTAEAGNTAAVQDFDRGRMVYLPQRNETIVLVTDPDGLGGTWRSFAGGA